MSIKKKYGRRLSWADLIILAGTVALENMSVKILSFSLGREDIYEPDESPDWGPEEAMLTGKERFEEGELRKPYAATEIWDRKPAMLNHMFPKRGLSGKIHCLRGTMI